MNIFNSARENACTRIYGDWVEEVTGVKCQPYVPPSQCEG
jgi:hypothetical protein